MKVSPVSGALTRLGWAAARSIEKPCEYVVGSDEARKHKGDAPKDDTHVITLAPVDAKTEGLTIRFDSLHGLSPGCPYYDEMVACYDEYYNAALRGQLGAADVALSRLVACVRKVADNARGGVLVGGACSRGWIEAMEKEWHP
jgi:hypothetical protein